MSDVLAEYARMVLDAAEQLVEDGRDGRGRVLALPIHPFIVNQPSRHRYLARALEEIAARDEVWLTTSDDIADHFLATREQA